MGSSMDDRVPPCSSPSDSASSLGKQLLRRSATVTVPHARRDVTYRAVRDGTRPARLLPYRNTAGCVQNGVSRGRGRTRDAGLEDERQWEPVWAGEIGGAEV